MGRFICYLLGVVWLGWCGRKFGDLRLFYIFVLVVWIVAKIVFIVFMFLDFVVLLFEVLWE